MCWYPSIVSDMKPALDKTGAKGRSDSSVYHAMLSVCSLLNIVSCWALGLFGCFLNMFSLWTLLDIKLQPLICRLEMETFGGILQRPDISKVPWKSGANCWLCQENSFKNQCQVGRQGCNLGTIFVHFSVCHFWSVLIFILTHPRWEITMRLL